MDSRTFILYGYSSDQALIITESLSRSLAGDVIVINAGGREEELIMDILSTGTGAIYEDREPKMLMFINFSDESISRAMKNFPSPEAMVRPMFCILTENNIQWKLSSLLAHLVEEKNSSENRK